jgi:hypothetical protein
MMMERMVLKEGFISPLTPGKRARGYNLFSPEVVE